MNPWKPVAIVSTAALALSIGVQVAAAGVCHDQPNMAGALSALRSAKGYLERAEHNKGGWRVSAIESTNKAIAEAERGCAFADTH